MASRVPVIDDKPSLVQEASNADAENLEDAVLQAFSQAFPKAPKEQQVVLAQCLFSLVGQLWPSGLGLFSATTMMRKPRAGYVRFLRRLLRILQRDIGVAYGNPEQVAAIARLVAQALSLPTQTVVFLELASYLHDVGKLYIPEQILLKPGPLSPEERDQIKVHVEAGAGLIAHLLLPSEVLTMVSQHHERFDGSGYPLRLKGPEIHIGAKILAVADVMEAITSVRPYRKALPSQRALEIVTAGSGSQFDPIVVDTLMRCLSTEGERCL